MSVSVSFPIIETIVTAIANCEGVSGVVLLMNFETENIPSCRPAKMTTNERIFEAIASAFAYPYGFDLLGGCIIMDAATRVIIEDKTSPVVSRPSPTTARLPEIIPPDSFIMARRIFPTIAIIEAFIKIDLCVLIDSLL